MKLSFLIWLESCLLGLSLELEFVPYQLSHCRFQSDKPLSWKKCPACAHYYCFKIGWRDGLVAGRKRPSSARLCRGQDQAHVHRGGSSQHHHRYVLAEDKSRIPDTCTVCTVHCTLYTYTVNCVQCTMYIVQCTMYTEVDFKNFSMICSGNTGWFLAKAARVWWSFSICAFVDWHKVFNFLT